jgi:hypothetical protein
MNYSFNENETTGSFSEDLDESFERGGSFAASRNAALEAKVLAQLNSKGITNRSGVHFGQSLHAPKCGYHEVGNVEFVIDDIKVHAHADVLMTCQESIVIIPVNATTIKPVIAESVGEYVSSALGKTNHKRKQGLTTDEALQDFIETADLTEIKIQWEPTVSQYPAMMTKRLGWPHAGPTGPAAVPATFPTPKS